MGRVKSNVVTLQVSEESALETAGTVWYDVPRTDLGEFGARTTSQSSRPAGANRRPQGSAIVDLDSGVSFSDEFRLGTFRRFLPGLLFVTPTAPGSTDVAVFSPSAVADGGANEDSFTVADDGDLPDNTLIYARGFAEPQNNGLFVTTGTSTTTAIKVATATLAAEGTAPGNATVEVAGVQGATGDLEINSSGNLISTSLNFTTLDLTEGQYIWIGGVAAATRFANDISDGGVLPPNRGLARIDAIAANVLTLSHKSSTFTTDDGSGKTIQVFFGEFLRDVDTTHASFLERSYQFEAMFPNLGGSAATRYQYAKGNFANTIQLGMPGQGLVTAAYSFIGTDTPIPTDTRATGASTGRQLTQRRVFSTAIHYMRLRLTDVDEAGLTTDFITWNVGLSNNVAPEKVQAQLGARYMNHGEFDVTLDATVNFSNEDVASRVRDNEIVELDWCLRNEDGAFHMQLPSARLSGGNLAFPTNQSVTMQCLATAEEDEDLGFAVGVSLFPYLPAS